MVVTVIHIGPICIKQNRLLPIRSIGSIQKYGPAADSTIIGSISTVIGSSVLSLNQEIVLNSFTSGDPMYKPIIMKWEVHLLFILIRAWTGVIIQPYRSISIKHCIQNLVNTFQQLPTRSAPCILPRRHLINSIPVMAAVILIFMVVQDFYLSRVAVVGMCRKQQPFLLRLHLLSATSLQHRLQPSVHHWQKKHPYFLYEKNFIV